MEEEEVLKEIEQLEEQIKEINERELSEDTAGEVIKPDELVEGEPTIRKLLVRDRTRKPKDGYIGFAKDIIPTWVEDLKRRTDVTNIILDDRTTGQLFGNVTKERIEKFKDKWLKALGYDKRTNTRTSVELLD